MHASSYLHQNIHAGRHADYQRWAEEAGRNDRLWGRPSRRSTRVPERSSRLLERSLGRFVSDALSLALRMAWERGRIAVDYSGQIKRRPEHNARHTWLDLDQVKRLANHASDAVRAAIWISVLTGCRRGEALSLRPEMIGRDHITLPAGATKTLRTRTVPIIAPLRPWLRYIGEEGLGINFEGLKSGFVRAREAAGMPEVQFRDLRRSTGTLLIQSGVPLHHVSQILGHTSTQVTERVYAHLAGSQLRDSMRTLDTLHRAMLRKKA